MKIRWYVVHAFGLFSFALQAQTLDLAGVWRLSGQGEFLELKTAHGLFRNDWHPGTYKYMPVADAKVALSVPAGFTVSVSADKPAFFVWLNAKNISGEFNDNSFTLLPGETRTLEFRPKKPVTLEAFRAAVTVTHLRETYE